MAPITPAQKPAIVMCSGTEYTLRMTTAHLQLVPQFGCSENRTGMELRMRAFWQFRGTKCSTLTGGAVRYVAAFTEQKNWPPESTARMDHSPDVPARSRTSLAARGWASCRGLSYLAKKCSPSHAQATR